MIWKDTDVSPPCPCGKDMIVMPGPPPQLLCFFHTNEEGATYALPTERPNGWETMTTEEQSEIIRAAYVAEEDE